MRIEVDAELGGALDHVLAVDAAGECLVLHLLSHACDLDFGDLLARLDEGASGEESGELIAGEEGFVEMCYAGDAGVLRVTEDGSAQFLQPALLLQFADADEGVLFGCRMALIIKVVEEGGGGIELD